MSGGIVVIVRLPCPHCHMAASACIAKRRTWAANHGRPVGCCLRCSHPEQRVEPTEGR